MRTVAVLVEQVECNTELLALILGQISRLLGTRTRNGVFQGKASVLVGQNALGCKEKMEGHDKRRTIYGIGWECS